MDRTHDSAAFDGGLASASLSVVPSYSATLDCPGRAVLDPVDFSANGPCMTQCKLLELLRMSESRLARFRLEAADFEPLTPRGHMIRSTLDVPSLSGDSTAGMDVVEDPLGVFRLRRAEISDVPADMHR